MRTVYVWGILQGQARVRAYTLLSRAPSILTISVLDMPAYGTDTPPCKVPRTYDYAVCMAYLTGRGVRTTNTSL